MYFTPEDFYKNFIRSFFWEALDISEKDENRSRSTKVTRIVMYSLGVIGRQQDYCCLLKWAPSLGTTLPVTELLHLPTAAWRKHSRKRCFLGIYRQQHVAYVVMNPLVARLPWHVPNMQLITHHQVPEVHLCTNDSLLMSCLTVAT